MLVSLVLSAISTTASAITALSAAIAAVSFVLVPLLLLVRALLPRPVLLSLPYSHFVESARWALERPASGRAPASFLELKVPVGPHVPIVGLYRLLFGGWRSESSYPGSTVKLSAGLRWTAFAPLLRRLTAIPCFITADGRCLTDSWACLADSGYMVRPEMRSDLDINLGPSVRQIGYYYIFQMPGVYRSLQSCAPALMAAFDAMEALFRTSTRTMPILMDINDDAIDCATRT